MNFYHLLKITFQNGSFIECVRCSVPSNCSSVFRLWHPVYLDGELVRLQSVIGSSGSRLTSRGPVLLWCDVEVKDVVSVGLSTVDHSLPGNEIPPECESVLSAGKTTTESA